MFININMLLKLLTWNINFIYDKWTERIININKVLEKEINDCDIIALQEATLPFSNTVQNIYHFLKAPIVNYVHHRLLSEEETFIYSKIKEKFPETKRLIIRIFEYCTDILLIICSYIFSKYGTLLQKIYFEYPILCFISVFLCPFVLIGSYFFLGMITIINKKINSIVKTKFMGRAIQYTEFEYNNRQIIMVNIHLNEGHNKTKRMNEITQIYDFIKSRKKDIIILAGDFNSKPSSEVYKFLINHGFKSVIKEIHGGEVNTWPSKDPTMCIDYIWIKGDNVTIKSAKILKYPQASDHHAIKAVIDII